MNSSTALRRIRDPVLALLVLYALAYNWAGITDSYFALWQWMGAQIQDCSRHALDTVAASP